MSDLISRSALKKYMRDYKWEFALNSDFSKAIEMVDVQPTIEAVPVVHGEWEVNGVNPHNMTIGNWRCTACDGISLKDSNFCPNCGAKMDGGKE